MLASVIIKNIAIIDYIKINFNSGFTIITGETGSGKSILFKAFNFLLGKTNSNNLLKDACKEGCVIATFTIVDERILIIFKKNNIILDNNNLVLKRNVIIGKTNCYINGRKVKLSMLKSIANELLEIHGQNDHIKDINRQISIIDKYGDISVININQVFYEWKESLLLLENFKLQAEKVLREKEYLSYLLKELEELSLQPLEEVVLKKQRELLLTRKKNFEILRQSLEQMSIAESLLSKICSLLNNSKVEQELSNYLEKSYIELKEGYDLANSMILSVTNSEFSSIDLIEERLFKLYAIARKYNKKVDELYDYQIHIKSSLQDINNMSDELLRLEKRCMALEENYLLLAEMLSKQRKNSALNLENIIAKELCHLKMSNAKFKIEIERLAKDQWTKDGIDKVFFKASLNPGSKMLLLSDVISGGEMSRFILALKTLNVSTPTIFFDEIDSGIGGAVSNAVGERLLNLSLHAQIVVITHQPQIAVKANTHFRVQKLQKQDNTIFSIDLITGEERIKEIARMISGENVSYETLAAANSLLMKTF